MSQMDLELGGGYVYQWECAVLLALNYLMDDPQEYSSELHKLVNDFLGRVEAIHLEGKERRDKAELEDINLHADDRIICIQVKAAESKWWTLGSRFLRKALYLFYRNTALDKNEPPARFVFLSNRGFNPDLNKLKKAIDAGTVAYSKQAETLFAYLQKHATKEYPADAPSLERPRFDRLLGCLTLIEFLAVDQVKPIIELQLRAKGVETCEQAYQSLFAEFTKRSVRKGGSTVTLSDLYEIVPDFFAGRLVDYIRTEPLRSVARYVLDRAEAAKLPPFGATSTAIIQKIEATFGDNAKALNEIEAFILLVAACLPHLLRWYHEGASQILGVKAQYPLLESPPLEVGTDQYDDHAEEPASKEQVFQLADKLGQDQSAPNYIRTASVNIRATLGDVASEVSAIANARTGFELEDTRYNDNQVRDTSVRLRLLAALLHLTDYINLDQAVDPTPPLTLDQASWPERYRWWRQAYVRGVSIESQRLRLHIRLPEGLEEKYRPILVDPLEEGISQLIDIYDPILFLAGINLKQLPAEVIEGAVPAVPDDEWQRLKQSVETEQIRKAKDQLQQDVQTQRLRELLVKDEISQAEQMITESRHLEAAKALASAVAVFVRAREAAQARRYATRAAEQYLEGGDRQAAARQYLQAAEVWLNNARTPELVTRQLEQAHKLSVELGTPALQVHVLLTQAWAAFATLRDHDAQRFLEQANELLPQIADEAQQAGLLRTLAVQHATLAMVWEEWNTAQEVLNAALLACPEAAQDERLDLFQSLLLVSTECGDWETADSAHQEAQQLLDATAEPRRQGVLAMHYGASLARRGALKEAYDIYSEAIQQLDGHANAYTLGLAYQNMQYMLLRNGATFFTGFAQHEARRIDLFNVSQAENRGYACELQATADLSAQKYRGALQRIRLALAHYWREGAWAGIEHAYQTVAALNAATNRPVEALLAAIRASDRKAAERYSETLRDKGDVKMLVEVVDTLATAQPAACEQQVAAKALGILADVIPPTQLKQGMDHLIALLQGPEDNQQHVAVRRHAVEALRYLVPQLTEEQTNTVVQVALDQLQRQQFWTITEELLKLLNECFILRQCQVDLALYAPVAEVMLTFSGVDHLRSRAESVAVHLARTAPPEVRGRVVAYLKDRPDQLDRLSQLAFLKEPIPEGQLGATIERILRAINPQPVAKGRTITIGFSAVRPRMVNNFNPQRCNLGIKRLTDRGAGWTSR